MMYNTNARRGSVHVALTNFERQLAWESCVGWRGNAPLHSMPQPAEGVACSLCIFSFFIENREHHVNRKRLFQKRGRNSFAKKLEANGNDIPRKLHVLKCIFEKRKGWKAHFLYHKCHTCKSESMFRFIEICFLSLYISLFSIHHRPCVLC